MTALRAFNEEQLRAIDRRRGDLLLDASAGSGKTSVLVERFARAVLEDGVAVTAILAITFTEKAAAELRDRIRARLHELGAPEQARATEGAFISTIHGFCARVLRAGALAAGLDPRFAVLDRDQTEPLQALAFEDALQELAAANQGVVGLVADFGAGPLRDTVVSLHAALRSRGERIPRLPAVGPVDDREARSALLSALATVELELAQVPDPSVRVLEAIARLERCRSLLDGNNRPWPAQLDWFKLPGNGAVLSTDACAAYGAALLGYRAALAAGEAGPVRDLIDALLRGFARSYAARKQAISGVDFEDLELEARALLTGSGELRDLYTGRFELIMVDELQDTNPVQLELIEAIARDNLFTVGDAQQSIYRFRHADVELFERRGERLAAAGARETLRTNYRSRPEILEGLNSAFVTALGERFRPLSPGREPRPEIAADADPLIELLLVDKGADWELEGLASPWRLAEARALAQRVAALVAQGTRPGDVVVLMRATTDMRAYERALERAGLPTYVIGGRGYWLHPQVLDLVCYLRALANPRDEQSLYTVLASPLVGASLDALVVLAGEAREHSRDPWWLLSESEGALSLDVLSDADRAALTRFAGWFGEERRRVARATIEDLIDGALSLTGYDVAMLAMPGGRRRLANVRKLMRLGREYEYEHGSDLRGFLALVGERAAGRAAGARESEAPVEGEGLDAVRLMTIHRSKGLEFDTVCVADLGRSVRPPHELVRVGADGRLGLRLSRAGAPGRVSALDYDELGQERRDAEELEERRLFYVAMTRARERLILSGATRFESWLTGSKQTGGGPVGWIAPAFVPEFASRLAEGSGVVELGGARVALRISSPEDVVVEAVAVDAPPAARPAALAPPAAPAPPPPPPAAEGARPPAVTTMSYSALGAYARCGYRFYAERVLGLPPSVEPSLTPDASASAAPRSALDRGTLIHELLAHLNFRRPLAPDGAAVTATAARLGLSPPPSPAEARELAQLIGAFAQSELCARLARATDARREQRFAFPLGDDGVLMTGAIDVIAREPGGTTLIVDYKSDRLEGADPATLTTRVYGTQRLVYAAAALCGGAESVEVVHCFLERPDALATATYGRDQLSELLARLTALAAGLARHEFPVSSLPHRALCAGCPAQDGLCTWPVSMTRREAPDTLF